MFNKNFIFILIFFIIFIIAEGNYEKTGYVHLTDRKTTHHKLDYLNTDQCMLRQEQKNIGSYGLIFDRQYGFLCDELIICYPSQLLGINVRNGLVSSIPYRLSRGRRNNVTKLCEVKRNEFCQIHENKELCSVGQPASTTWHGILLKTEYEEDKQHSEMKRNFITTILLSLNDLEYRLTNILTFDIEFGKKDELFTHIYETQPLRGKHVKVNQVFFEKDNQLRNEYLSKIEKGAFIYKYGGLWALGLDILPIRAQRLLDLFVYRGCGCPMNVWFKTPTTSEKSLPTFHSTKIEVIEDKDCRKRNTSPFLENLGPILLDEEKNVYFTLMTGYEGKSGEIVLFGDNTDKRLFTLLFYKDIIQLISPDSRTITTIIPVNVMISGLTIDISMQLTKYYAWILISIDNNEPYLIKYWPINWWEGKFFNNISELYLGISGDFLRVTPIQTEIHNKNGVNEFDLYKIIMPYSFKIDEFPFHSIVFRFCCIINEDATKFSIKFLYGAREENDYSNFVLYDLKLYILSVGSTLFGLDVDLNQNKVYVYSKMFNEMKGAKNSTNIIFKKGKPFDCSIYVEMIGLGSSIALLFNDKIQQNFSIYSQLPQWMINSISMSGDIQLLDYKSGRKNNTLSFKYKKEIEELKSYGTILCFEGIIPSANVIENGHGFAVYLLHDASEPNEEYGDLVFMLDFIFEFKNISLGGNKTYLLQEQSSLLLFSSGKDREETFEHGEFAANPLQTGMEITMLIYANSDSYIISINGGDFFYYPHKMPPWTVNHAMVDGYINNVYFDTEKCSRLANKLNLTEFQLPNNVLKVKPLENNEMIIIIGEIKEEELIIVYLFNGAIKRHNEYGNLVLNINITKNNLIMNSLARKQWLLKNNIQIEHNISLKKGINIEIKFYYSPKKINFEIETKEDYFEGSYNELIPYNAIDYIEVQGLEKIEQKFKMLN